MVTTTPRPDSSAYAQDTISGWHYSEADLLGALRGDLLLNPSIDLSNACNLNCGYCFIEEKNSSRKVRLPSELTIDETIAVIDDFANAGARTVNLVGAGEPTTDPNFDQIVIAIAGRGLTPVVFTNGIRLAHDPKAVDLLHDSKATVVLKYNAADHSIQDLVAGRAGYAVQRDHALECLVARGFTKANPTRLGLDIIAFEGIFHELPAIHRWCRARNIYPLIADFIPTGRTEGGHFVGIASAQHLPPTSQEELLRILRPLNEEKRRWLISELAAIDAREFGIGRIGGQAYYGGGACTQSLGLYVDIQGNIWPCVARTRNMSGVLKPGFLGNIRQGDTASNVWRNHPYLEHVRSTFNGSCPYKASLNGTVSDLRVPRLVRINGGVS